MALVLLLVLLCTGAAWASPSTTTSRAESSSTTTTTTTTTTSPTNSVTTISPSGTPSAEQLVARIRSLVRALRDADQLLRALRVFREQQGDDIVLNVMKEEANRTLVAQVMQAMEREPARREGVLGAMGMTLTATTSTPRTARKLSAKIPYNAYGKKSAKFTAGQSTTPSTKAAAAGKAAVASGAAVKQDGQRAKPAESTTPSYKETGNGTVVTRVKTDPILGTYKVVIRDLTPAASAGINPSEAAKVNVSGKVAGTLRVSGGSEDTKVGGGRKEEGGKDSSKEALSKVAGGGNKDVTVVTPPVTEAVTGTPSPNERGRYRFQDTLSAPSSTATAAPGGSTTQTATRRSGKVGKPVHSKPVHSKKSPAPPTAPTSATVSNSTGSTTSRTPSTTGRTPSTTSRVSSTTGRISSTTGKTLSTTGRTSSTTGGTTSIAGRTASTTARAAATTARPAASNSHISTTTSIRPVIMKKSFQKKASGDALQVRVAATLRTAPVEREEEAGRQRAPLETPILSSIFPRYGPGAELPQVERPFVPSGRAAGPPANILLPPLPAATRPAATTPLGMTVALIPKPAEPADREEPAGRVPSGGAKQTVQLEIIPSQDVASRYFLGESPWVPISPPTASPTTTTTPTSERLTAATSQVLRPPQQQQQQRAPLNDNLEWRPSRTWQYSIQQDRLDTNLHDLPLSETMYYRLRPSELDDPYDGIPGLPGLDYPAFSRPPTTAFTCAVFRRKGYYADPASGCQAFYVCHGDGRGEAMLCPNGTIFSQEVLVCDWWFNVHCR